MPIISGPAEILCKNEKGEIVPWLPITRKFYDGSIDSDLPLIKIAE